MSNEEKKETIRINIQIKEEHIIKSRGKTIVIKCKGNDNVSEEEALEKFKKAVLVILGPGYEF